MNSRTSERPPSPPSKRRKLSLDLSVRKVQTVNESTASLSNEDLRTSQVQDHKERQQSIQVEPASPSIKPNWKFDPRPRVKTESEEYTSQSEGYYLSNFKFILREVMRNSPERHVLTACDTRTVEGFNDLALQEQQLYVRLFLRKHQWLRADKISYKDIGDDLITPLAGLVRRGLLLDETCLTDVSDSLGLLQLPELKEMHKLFNLVPVRTGVKAAIIESFFQHSREYKPLFGQGSFMDAVHKRVKKKLGSCVCISSMSEVFSKIIILFSLTTDDPTDEEKDFSQIIYKQLLVNTGSLRYPDYEINVTQSLFKTQEIFQKYYEATQLDKTLSQAIADKDSSVITSLDIITRFKSETQSLNTSFFLRPYTCAWLFAKMLSKIAEYLEKTGGYMRANETLECLLSQDTVCTGSRGRWWDRLALNYDFHLKEKEKCLEVINSALEDHHVRPSHRMLLIKRARKVCESIQKKSIVNARKSKFSSKFKLSDFPEIKVKAAPEVTITGAIMKTTVKPYYLASSSSSSQSKHSTSILNVEGYAMHHYSIKEGWPCAVHGEGSCFSHLFTLLMWDVIFVNGVPDVFRNKYQSCPLDLRTSNFYQNRREMIESKLSYIRSATSEVLSTCIEDCWSEHHGTVCATANWELFTSVEDVKSLAVSMGGLLLSQVCEVFCEDCQHSASGLPDLTLWNPLKNSCKFVEVKGPGDRLSTKQMLWLSRLVDWGCEVEVCRVKASSNKSLE